MAQSKVPASRLLSIILLLLFIQSHAVFSHSGDKKETSPFEFIKHLEGCHKGDKVKGLDDLKKYLQKFGYLNSSTHYPNSQTDEDADEDFDDLLESAIKTYQANYHLEVTGTLDAPTVTKMTAPRCGVADIINGTNLMRSNKINNHHKHKDHNEIHVVKHYTFFNGAPRWPSDEYHLTYGFLPNTPTEAMNPVAQAFDRWASVTKFTFTYVEDYTMAYLKIGFASGDHGDGYPFDGKGGILAHSFPPTNGVFHYDADESWSAGANPSTHDLGTVALHEIGHLLGLGHSSVLDAIMYPTINYGVIKGLHEDDIQGIHALYGF